MSVSPTSSTGSGPDGSTTTRAERRLTPTIGQGLPSASYTDDSCPVDNGTALQAPEVYIYIHFQI